MADDVASPEGKLSGPPDAPTTPPTDSGGGSSESPHEITSESVDEAASAAETEDAQIEDDETDDVEAVDDYAEPAAKPARKPMSVERLALIVVLVVVVALAGLGGWLGFRAYQSHQAKAQRELFLQVGRQGAINLTTIDFSEADTDIQRILDSATGSFYDDFSKRSQPFVDAVKQAQSKSVGTVTAAGLESVTDRDARVLVAVTVKTSNAGAADQAPRHWRMRISVQKVGNQAKVSNVDFVP
jgi:Mce-associated membrane protein